MSLLRRITTTLSTQVDRLVTELQNHDAVVEAGIRDTRKAYARAKVRHARMAEEGERMRRKLEALQNEAKAWRERAVTCADEERALECLRRSKLAAAQAQSLEQTLARHRETAQRLKREIQAVRERIEDLQHKRHLMRSRESTAEAASGIARMEDGTTLDLEETFERWEIRVTEAELGAGTLPEDDALEADFVAEEERAGLKAELEALKLARETGTGGKQ